MSREREALNAIVLALSQAQDCLLGEQPEEISFEAARADTLEKLRDAQFDLIPVIEAMLEKVAALDDARIYGTGFLYKGKHIDAKDVAILNAPQAEPSQPDEERARELVLSYHGKTFHHAQEATRYLEKIIAQSFSAIREDERKIKLQPIETAPRIIPILLKFKDDLSPYYGAFEDRVRDWEGRFFVGRASCIDEKDHKLMGWNFAGPIGIGGFPDCWLAGWMQLTEPPKETP